MFVWVMVVFVVDHRVHLLLKMWWKTLGLGARPLGSETSLRLEHIFRAIDDSGDGIITEVAGNDVFFRIEELFQQMTDRHP